MYAPTLREVPAEAEVVSHQLMLRAGFSGGCQPSADAARRFYP